jgi:hypothetical protein
VTDGRSIESPSVRLASNQSTDVTFVPSLDPFRVDVGDSDISIQVGWAVKLR